ncbi:hypothetical protein CsSME_00033553 [Camellia sinensis var. sinensis]
MGERRRRAASEQRVTTMNNDDEQQRVTASSERRRAAVKTATTSDDYMPSLSLSLSNYIQRLQFSWAKVQFEVRKWKIGKISNKGAQRCSQSTGSFKAWKEAGPCRPDIIHSL